MSLRPFFDYTLLPPDALEQLRLALRERELAMAAFLRNPTHEHVARWFNSGDELVELVSGAKEACYCVPAIVHIAGPVVPEESEGHEGHEHLMQRCARCSSVLLAWCSAQLYMTPAGPLQVDRDSIEWIEEGAIVGKHTNEDETAQACYLIDRDLYSYEKECIGNDIPVLAEEPRHGDG